MSCFKNDIIFFLLGYLLGELIKKRRKNGCFICTCRGRFYHFKINTLSKQAYITHILYKTRIFVVLFVKMDSIYSTRF